MIRSCNTGQMESEQGGDRTFQLISSNLQAKCRGLFLSCIALPPRVPMLLLLDIAAAIRRFAPAPTNYLDRRRRSACARAPAVASSTDGVTVVTFFVFLRRHCLPPRKTCRGFFGSAASYMRRGRRTVLRDWKSASGAEIAH